jgi:hypothetical protein
MINSECGNSKRWTCAAACIDEVSCRMFLCARCRSQVFICRRCDRGHIYCIGTCAQEARCDNQGSSAALSGNSTWSRHARRPKSPSSCERAMRDGSWSRQRTKSGAFSRIGGRRGLAPTVVQQKVAATMALSSLQALGFGICAPVSPSSYMSPWQERAKGPCTQPSTLTARPRTTPLNRRHSGIHRMVERAAPRRRAVKPEAANGGGPKGQALQPDGGEQTIELAIR